LSVTATAKVTAVAETLAKSQQTCMYAAVTKMSSGSANQGIFLDTHSSGEL